ncbi:MAG: hypothetical protein V5A43_08365 [Haloarculaceae archaeon]
MSETPPEAGGTDEPADRDELRLRLYESLERRVELERESRLRRLLWSGIAIVGLLGYAIAVGPAAVVALTPILFGLVVMDALRTTVTIWYLQRHLVQVEAELRDREPLFSWVSRYGSLSGGRSLELSGVNLNEIPRIALYVLLVTVYLALVALSLQVWPAGDAGAAAFAVSRTQLLVGYGLFTVVFGLIVAVVYLNFKRLRRSIADRTLPERVGGRE